MWQNMATCAHLKQTMTKCRGFAPLCANHVRTQSKLLQTVGDSRPLRENPVRPDPVWERMCFFRTKMATTRDYIRFSQLEVQPHKKLAPTSMNTSATLGSMHISSAGFRNYNFTDPDPRLGGEKPTARAAPRGRRALTIIKST